MKLPKKHLVARFSATEGCLQACVMLGGGEFSLAPNAVLLSAVKSVIDNPLHIMHNIII